MREPSEVTWVKLPVASYVIVRNFDEFKDYIINNGLPAHVSFDHDLADLHYGGVFNVEKTGYDCAKWLVDHCIDNDLKLPAYTVHSMNEIGKENIHTYLANAKRRMNL
jgi:hypothetical protein